MTTTGEQLSKALSGRFAVDRLLGRGGMASVYLARDLRHDRWVALKVLRREIAANVGAERFLREIHIAASLAVCERQIGRAPHRQIEGGVAGALLRLPDQLFLSVSKMKHC